MELACVKLSDAKRWLKNGWLSFDPSDNYEWKRAEIRELCFVRNIARSGLSTKQISRMLEELKKPYRYDPIRTAYSFSEGWVEAPPADPEEFIDDLIERNIEAWVRRAIFAGEKRKVTTLMQRITAISKELISRD